MISTWALASKEGEGEADDGTIITDLLAFLHA